MPDFYLKNLIRDNQKLFSLIYEFNMYPSRYIHESWIDSFSKISFFKKLQKSDRAQRKISALIFKKFDLEEKYCFNFENPFRLLALADTDGIYKLTYYSGLALNTFNITKIIERDALMLLKKEIGENAYSFSIKKAPFLMGKTRFDFIKKEEKDSGDFHSYVLQCGVKCLEAGFMGEPEGLVRRILLKLPQDFSRYFGENDLEQYKDKARTLLRKIFLQEVNPSWASYNI